jgi:hypothetical protein
MRKAYKNNLNFLINFTYKHLKIKYMSMSTASKHEKGGACNTHGKYEK